MQWASQSCWDMSSALQTKGRLCARTSLYHTWKTTSWISSASTWNPSHVNYMWSYVDKLVSDGNLHCWTLNIELCLIPSVILIGCCTYAVRLPLGHVKTCLAFTEQKEWDALKGIPVLHILSDKLRFVNLMPHWDQGHANDMLYIRTLLRVKIRYVQFETFAVELRTLNSV
jgi:hypothetical protein